MTRGETPFLLPRLAFLRFSHAIHSQVRYHEPLAALSCRDVPAGPAMKEFYICDCARLENQTITSLFVVAAKQVKSKKNGELYLSVTLADRSGQLPPNMWDNVADTLDSFEQDDFVKVKGVVHKYNGRWQLTIHKLRKLEDPEIDYSDYLPKTSKDIDGLWRTLSEFVESFENRWLKSLLQEFMADEAIVAAYKNEPAAKTLHHAFVGGVLDFRVHGNDRAGAHEHRQLFERRSVVVERHRSVELRAVPVVNPLSGRQVDVIADRRVLVNRGDEQRFAGHELILRPLGPGRGVVGKLQDHRADGRHAGV